MSKFQTLINVLEQLRLEAPANFKRYYPLDSDEEGFNQAKARAFIHLFLKVKFGLLDFKSREHFITDGSYDGGIDAYFIDEEHKKIYFIQSKFRIKEGNFKSKEIQFSELLNMDVDRITDGEEEDESGNVYNGKIKQLQRELSEISDIARYKYEIVILANLKETPQSKLRKLTGFPCIVYDYERTYKELLFPVIKGTFYNPSELKIYINLTNKSSSNAKVTYEVNTKYKDCDITLLFVPTIEIAKTLYKYKNSILKFNPRSYLELANNTVNKDISKTITELDTNEFALYNNGITMLSYGTDFNEKIGKKDKAQLIVTQPQIINGGQTAYTLSRLYEDNINSEDVEELFENKEVLLKVITFQSENDEGNTDQLKLIETISKATNQQTPVDEADRRSNDSIQIQLQNAIFDKYGYFYERKRGEYADGLRAGYINRSEIIDRELFIRLCKCCDFNPSEARRSSVKLLFKEDSFNKTLNDVTRYEEYFFAFRCYEKLNSVERGFSKQKNNQYGQANYGSALRYGKFAVVSACMIQCESNFDIELVEETVQSVLERWLSFESQVIKLPSNNSYFFVYLDDETGTEKQYINFDGYYKGRTVNQNIKSYFKKK